MGLGLENSTLDFSYSLHRYFFSVADFGNSSYQHEMISKSEVNSKQNRF